MRHSLVQLLVPLLVLAAGCAAYDRELLGRPEPLVIRAAVPTMTSDEMPSDGYLDDAEVPESPAFAVDADATPIVVATGQIDIDPILVPVSVTVGPSDIFSDLRFWGNWYQLGQIGLVWRPALVLGWRPFENGRWVRTSYGWMFESYDLFGWITYHYGNWFYADALGWVWVPGYDWVACNCDWMLIGDLIVWAPSPPIYHPCPLPWEPGGDDWWTCVPARDFTDADLGRHRVPPAKFKSEYRKGKIYRGAPDVKYVEKATRAPVKQVAVDFDTRYVQGQKIMRTRPVSAQPPRVGKGTAPRTPPAGNVVGGTGGAPPEVSPPRSSPGTGAISRPRTPVSKAPEARAKSKEPTAKSGSAGSGSSTAKAKGSSSSKGGSKSPDDKDTNNGKSKDSSGGDTRAKSKPAKSK